MLVSNLKKFRHKNKDMSSTAILARKMFEIQLKPAERKVSSRSKFEKHIKILSIPAITFQVF